MSTDKGFFFINSDELDVDEIISEMDEELLKIDMTCNKNMKINVVKDKRENKLGYSYGWVESVEIYNVLIGLNKDGSERIEYIDDPNWTPPIEEKSLAEVESWADLAEEEAPLVRVVLDPLIMLKSITINPSIVDSDSNKQNIIFSKNLDKWITEKILHKYFDFYEKDKTVHKNKNTKKSFNYPLIKINNNFVFVTFSPLYKKTASFVINMVKKIKIADGKGREKLLFFTQSVRK